MAYALACFKKPEYMGYIRPENGMEPPFIGVYKFL